MWVRYDGTVRVQYYVELVCGTLDNLPKVFAELDQQRNKKPAGLETDDRKAPMAPDITDVISASLPAADRKLIRAPALQARILAAARSRAPVQAISTYAQP